MKYLVDTDVLISHLKRKKMIPIEKMKEGLGISVITYGELLVGIIKSNNETNNRKILESFLKEAKIEIYDIDEEIIREYAKNKAELEQKGNMLDDFDLLIAATALRYSSPLLTYNFKHFTKIPHLKIQ